jgi:serine/threonine-protein kinase
MSDLFDGKLVCDGRFRLVRPLGEGGMGVVWQAVDKAGESVALKFLTVAAASRQEFHDRLRQEARATAAISHPNVVRFLDICEDEHGFPVLVMEYLVGESLADTIEREGWLSLPDTAFVLVPVLSAVAAAHALGIVHRDLKPENIFLAHTSEGLVVPRIVDFGIAKLTGYDIELARTRGITQTGAILGTPHFMSPEQASGEKDIDAGTDIWALGVIAYQCLAGRLPVEGENFGQFFKNLLGGKVEPLQAVRPDLPAEVLSVIMRALTVDRSARLADLHELAAVLRPHLAATPSTFAKVRTFTPSVPRTALPSPAAMTAAVATFAPSVSTPRATRRRAPLAAGALVVLAISTAAVVTIARHLPSVLAKSKATGSTDLADAAPVVTTAPSDTGSGAVAIDGGATPEPTVVAVVDAGHRRPATVRPHPPNTAAGAKSAAPAGTKLQGGVAGEVPF